MKFMIIRHLNYVMRSLISLIVAAFSVSAYAEEPCPIQDLGAFLDHENSRVIAFVKSLSTVEAQPPLSGFNLCNGDTLFKGWRFVGLARGLRHGQHAYLLSHGRARRAVAWVDQGAQRLLIPSCPSHIDCKNQPEGQNDIAGEVFTSKFIDPGEGPIILLFPLRQWFPA